MTRSVDREGPVQKAIVEYLERVLPPECIVHFAKGEINKRGAAFMREIARAKSLGAKKGFPDLIVLTFQGVLFFEVKAPGNYPDATQRAMHDSLRALGCRVAVVRGVDDVRAALAEWHIGTRERLA